MFLLHIKLAGYCLRYTGYDSLLPFTISMAHRENSSDRASNVTLYQDTKLIVVTSWLALKALCLSQKSLPLCEDDVELLCNAYNINLMFVVDQQIKCRRGRLPFHSHGKKAATNIFIAAMQCNIGEGPFAGLSID